MTYLILRAKTAKYMRGLPVFLTIIVITVLMNACSKVNDSTYMDISLSPPAAAFNIPIISSTAAGTNIAEITPDLKLDSMIKLQAPRFSAANITSIKMTGYRLQLTDSVEEENNFSNIENITVSVKGGGTNSNAIAALSIADNLSGTINIPITATDNDLKSFFNGGDAKYILTGKLRRPSTKILKAKATVTYRLQLSL